MSVVVIGSANTDLVVRVPYIPKEGETLLGSRFETHHGGKGANQAVAAARAGAQVYFIGNIGQDDNGNRAVDNLQHEGVNMDFTVRSSGASGVALIMVSESGQNSIAVAPESNFKLHPDDLWRSESTLKTSQVMLTQLEVPLATVMAASQLAKQHNIPFILNPAPAQPLPDELLRNVGVLTPNETEAGILTGIQVVDPNSAREAASFLIQKGVSQVIITLGEKGVLFMDKGGCEHIPTKKVKAVDSTAAGDTFNGVLAHQLATTKNIKQAIQYANAAAALSVTRAGAQSSAPFQQEIEVFVQDKACNP